MPRWTAKGAAALAAALAAAWLWPAGMGCAGDRAAILEGPVTVIDGDTIEIGERRVRLFGIDAPEVAQMCRRRGGTRWPCGQYATVALDRLAGGKRATCTVRNTDSYGRAIAVCTSEGRDLGREQVRAGWAIAYRRYSRRYEQDEAAARRAGKGIWQGDFEPPWRWRERHPRR